MIPLFAILALASIEVGQRAPDFSAIDAAGTRQSLAECRGKTVILAFFPGDFTPGCTAEVRAFREAMPKIENRDAVVFGISGDGPDTRRRFAVAERLNFPLLIDDQNKLANLYGVPIKDGRPARTTVIIGPDGTIVGVDRDVDRQFAMAGKELTTRHPENLALFLSDWHGEIGQAIPNFWLQGDGKTVSTFTPDKPIQVFWFLDPNCPTSKEIAPVIATMHQNPLLSKVSWIGVDSVPSASAKELAAFVSAQHLSMSAGLDLGGYARRFGATKTGEVWVTDSSGVVIYRGAIDSNTAGPPTGRLLLEALYATLSRRRVAVPEFHGDQEGIPLS